MHKIIKATTADAKTLAKVGKEAFLTAHGHSAPKADIDKYTSTNFTESNFLVELSKPINHYYIIYHNDAVAGYSKIILAAPNSNVQPQNITKLERLYLLEAFYGLQLGKELFNFNVDLAKQHNQKGMWLAVWTENHRAIQFYNKSGFKIVGNFDFKISETHSNPNHIMYLNF